jgi:hypothetical protein
MAAKRQTVIDGLVILDRLLSDDLGIFNDSVECSAGPFVRGEGDSTSIYGFDSDTIASSGRPE